MPTRKSYKKPMRKSMKKPMRKSVKSPKRTTKKHSKKHKGGAKKSSKSSRRSTRDRGPRRKQWYCFGTMTILSNHKRTAEKYLNQLDNAGVRPEEIKIYQGKGQNITANYSRINICYFADRRILTSRL